MEGEISDLYFTALSSEQETESPNYYEFHCSIRTSHSGKKDSCFVYVRTNNTQSLILEI